MAQSVIKSIKPVAEYYANVITLTTKGYIGFDAESWADALPGRKTTKAITVETDFTYAIHNQPDYHGVMGYKFQGDFKKKGGVWTGEIDRVQFLRDGKVMGVLEVKSDVDLDRVVNVYSAGMIWNELTVTGVKGVLGKGRDDLNGSLGDDVINLGAGPDQINASRGNDLIRGGGGADMIDGYDGNDRIKGGSGDDFLIGNGGDDRLWGQAGDDIFFIDGQGDNIWKGGKGADHFQAAYLNWDGTASTRVRDFNLRQGDTLDLSNLNPLLYNEVDEVRYIGKRDFSGADRVLEIRMEKGLVTMDANGDGTPDYGLMLDRMGTIRTSNTSWIELPDGWEIG